MLGDIISQKSTPIHEDTTLDELYSRLSYLGRDLLMETLPSIIDGTNNRVKQNEDEVTFGYNITKEEEKLTLMIILIIFIIRLEDYLVYLELMLLLIIKE